MSTARTLRVAPAEGRVFRDFVRLPHRLYAGTEQWVAPLTRDVKEMFDPGRHPFHLHSEVQPFVAYAGDRAVGRIAAIHNRNHVAFHEEAVGFFGFFEAENDPDVAEALFEASAAWLRERDLETMRGPTSFSTNEEAGLLVEGFEHPPVVMMPYNPAFYAELVEGAGFEKAKDLIAYRLGTSIPPESLVRREKKLSERLGVRTRTLRMDDFEAELKRVRDLYNRAWEKNWGFVPMTDPEIEHMARQLKPLVARQPEQVIFAENEAGDTIGFTLWLFDYNRALRHAKGRLFPFGILKVLRHMRGIDFCRVLTLGLVPEARGLGIDNLLIMALFRHGRASGIMGGEFSWILEDNVAMRKPLERIGSEIYKRYRIYDRPL
jgi:ribosomal protein S18 acetylase RimI-like enzyme